MHIVWMHQYDYRICPDFVQFAHYAMKNVPNDEYFWPFHEIHHTFSYHIRQHYVMLRCNLDFLDRNHHLKIQIEINVPLVVPNIKINKSIAPG